jgi:hypothetical protein
MYRQVITRPHNIFSIEEIGVNLEHVASSLQPSNPVFRANQSINVCTI